MSLSPSFSSSNYFEDLENQNFFQFHQARIISPFTIVKRCAELDRLNSRLRFQRTVIVILFARVGHANDGLSSPSGSQSNLNLAANAYDTLSDLGVKLLRCETARYGIVNYLLNSISWTDSANSLKASIMMPVIVKQLMADALLTPELAVQVLTSLLQGLQVHGQHDANQGSLLNGAVQVYQMLRPMYQQILELMTMVPGIVLNDLQKFDSKVLNVAMPHKVDKGEIFERISMLHMFR
jgi:exportin-5